MNKTYILKCTDGRYINKKFKPTSKLEDALVFTSADNAENARKHSLSSDIDKKMYQVVEVKGEQGCMIDLNSIPIDSIPEEYSHITDCLLSVKNQLNELIDERERLSNKLSQYDQQLSDIYHHIEFDTRTDRNIKKDELLKERALMREVLKNRRQAKNKIQVLVKVENDIKNTAFMSSIDSTLGKIISIQDKVYTPRTDILEEK